MQSRRIDDQTDSQDVKYVEQYSNKSFGEVKIMAYDTGPRPAPIKSPEYAGKRNRVSSWIRKTKSNMPVDIEYKENHYPSPGNDCISGFLPATLHHLSKCTGADLALMKGN